ncbi:MAG: hypothetical protein OER95_02810 [Acidimicrobiia bacterium]|nr:hypothetical protein [Acidimicrobiia bacterium]
MSVTGLGRLPLTVVDGIDTVTAAVAFHLNPKAFERDRKRDGTPAQVGRLVRRFTWYQWEQ